MYLLKALPHYLWAASCILLGMTALVISRDNHRLHDQLEVSITQSGAWAAGCTLPSGDVMTAASTRSRLEFPRSHPLLMLSIEKTCKHCESALTNWPGLVGTGLSVDAVIYNRHASYSPEELRRAGVGPEQVLISLPSMEPYMSLFAATPTIALFSRTGTVLGLWRGELTGTVAATIKTQVRALIN